MIFPLFSLKLNRVECNFFEILKQTPLVRRRRRPSSDTSWRRNEILLIFFSLFLLMIQIQRNYYIDFCCCALYALCQHTLQLFLQRQRRLWSTRVVSINFQLLGCTYNKHKHSERRMPDTFFQDEENVCARTN